MPTYRVEAVLARTYGSAIIEADTPELAREIANEMTDDEFDTAEDLSLDVLDVYPEEV